MINYFNKYIKYKKKYIYLKNAGYNKIQNNILNSIKNYNIDEFINEFKKINDNYLLFKIKRTIDLNSYTSYFKKYDMNNIIFKYLDKKNKNDLLDHIQKINNSEKKIHIISDIDDTIFASSTGGTDNSFINYKLYPGIIDLFNILKKESKYITFLSARPEIFNNKKKFINIPHNILNGNFYTLLDGSKGLINISLYGNDNINNYKNIAEKKINSYINYQKIYPEYKFIFFGDLGQGDIIVAKELLKNNTLIVILHDIYRNNNWVSLSRKKEINKILELYGPRVFIIKTYPEFIKQLLNRYDNNLLNEGYLNNLLTKEKCFKLLKNFEEEIDIIDESIYKNELIKLFKK